MSKIEDATIITTEVSLRDRALGELSKVEAGLAEMKEKYGAKVYDCTKTLDMAQAKADRLAIREVRYRIPKIQDEVTKQLNAAKAEVKTEAERIISELMTLENISHGAIIAEETRKETEKAAKAAAEAERIAGIQALITRIRSIPSLQFDDSAAIAACIEQTTSIAITAEHFHELTDEAELAKKTVLTILDGLLVAACVREEEQRKIEADRAELEELRAKQADMQRQLDEANAAEQARLDAEKAKIEAERVQHEKKMADEQAEIDRIAAEAEAKRKAEQAAIDHARFMEETARQVEEEKKQRELDRIAEEERKERERVAEEARKAADLKAKEAEAARKKAEKAAKLAAAKCATASIAFHKIMKLCKEVEAPCYQIDEIMILCEANV